MKNNYIQHPWLENYPILPKHKHLIIGTHPPMPYKGCIPFFYGNRCEFWRLIEKANDQKLFFTDLGTPNLNGITQWLNSNKIGNTDMVQYTKNNFSTDQKMIVENNDQLNLKLKDWLESGSIENIFFTSFSNGKSAYNLFRRWFRLNYDIRLKEGNNILVNDNKYSIHIGDKTINIYMLYSPSPAARRGIARSRPYQRWLELNKEIENPIDEFRIYWYKKYFLSIINEFNKS